MMAWSKEGSHFCSPVIPYIRYVRGHRSLWSYFPRVQSLSTSSVALKMAMTAPGVLIACTRLAVSPGVLLARRGGGRSVEPGAMGIVVPVEPSPGRTLMVADSEPSSVGISTILSGEPANPEYWAIGVTVRVDGSNTFSVRGSDGKSRGPLSNLIGE